MNVKYCLKLNLSNFYFKSYFEVYTAKTGKNRGLQGNPCNENRIPAMRTGFPVMKTSFP